MNARLRAIKISLESGINEFLTIKLSIFEWALEHAAFIHNRFQVGHDGQTPYRRSTGKTWRQRLVEFGEQVFGKLAAKRVVNKSKTKTVHKNKMATRWIRGTWVGMTDRSHESILITRQGKAVRVRTIKRTPIEERWSAEEIKKIVATPRNPVPGEKVEEPEARHAGEQAQEAPEEAGAEEAPKQERDEPRLPRPMMREGEAKEMRITKRMLEQFGYSTEMPWNMDCLGCTHSRLGLDHRAHSSACRERIYKAMAESESIKDKEILESAIKRQSERGMSDKQVREELRAKGKDEEDTGVFAHPEVEVSPPDQESGAASSSAAPSGLKGVRLDEEQEVVELDDAVEEDTGIPLAVEEDDEEASGSEKRAAEDTAR